MSNPILVVQELYKAYGDIHAVRGVSFQVARGEIFGLLGPNGAGKTTTVSILTGLLAPDRGQITLGGVSFRSMPNAVKARIGLVPQDLALYPTLSARDNLLFFGRLHGLRGKRLRERVETVLEIVQLAPRAGDAVHTFSGGMKRRLNLAVGLLHEPELLFLDEPTVGVDPQSRNAIFETVEALNRSGLTILYTTHYMEEAQRLCHRVAIMDQGQIIALDTPAALIREWGSGLIIAGFPEEAIPTVASRLEAHPAVKAIRPRDSRLYLDTRDTQAALLALLDTTNRLSFPLKSLEILEANLETVFLHLTGRRLRD